MKMKRILSALVAAATAFSVIGSQAVFAAGETYVRSIDFNSAQDQVNNTGNAGVKGASGEITVSGAQTGSFSIKEESDAALAGDKYVQYNVDANKTGEKNLLWFRFDKDYDTPVYLEFDCKIANLRRNIVLVTNFTNNPYNHRFFTLSPDGKVTLGDPRMSHTTDNTVTTKNIPVKADMWYHISIGRSGNTAVCYVDGEKIIDMEWKKGGMTSRDSGGNYSQYFNLRTDSTDTRAETICIDNFKVYQSANGFDDAFAGNAAYIESVADGMGIDKTNLKLELTNDMLDAETILKSVTPAAGATAVCDMESGTLTVTSQNKKISRIYTFSVPAFTSRAYTIDTDKETISTLYKYTSVADFLSSFTVNSGKIKLMNGSDEVTDGYVTNDMVLRYFEDAEDEGIYTDYSLVFYGGIIDVNFDGVTITDDQGSGYGTRLGYGYNTNAPLSVVKDAEKGSDVLKYDGKDFVNFGMMGNFAYYKAFEYSAYNLEFSFKALDDNARIQMATKDMPGGNNGSFGPDIRIHNGGKVHYYHTGAGTEKADAEVNKWHNVVYSVKAAKDADGKSWCTIYLDGKKVGEYECNDKPEKIAYERIVLGPQDTSKPTTMLIDDVKLYPVGVNGKAEYFDDRYIAVSAAEGTDVLTVSGDEIVLAADNTPIEQVGGVIVPNENVADMVYVGADGTVYGEEDQFDVGVGTKLIIRNMTGESVRVYNFTVAAEPALAVYDANNARLTDKFTAGTLYAKASDAALTGECLLVLASYNADGLTAGRVVTVSAAANSAAELTVGDDVTAVKAFLISKATFAPAADAVSLSK